MQFFAMFIFMSYWWAIKKNLFYFEKGPKFCIFERNKTYIYRILIFHPILMWFIVLWAFDTISTDFLFTISKINFYFIFLPLRVFTWEILFYLQILVEGTVGSSFKGDIAVDDFVLDPFLCGTGILYPRLHLWQWSRP
jgi:hypothetical protein